MKKRQGHTRQFQALILLLIFAGSILARTTHSLLPHDGEFSQIPSKISTTHELSTKHFSHCAVCEFEFCTFIPEKQTNLPAINCIIQPEPACGTFNHPANVIFQLFQLRAPPAL